MQTLIIGAGAMGILFAARLGGAGFPVALFDINQPKMERLQQQGICLTEMDGTVRRLRVPCLYRTADCPRADLVLVMVKNYAIPRVLQDLPAFDHSGLLVASMQNGMGGAELLNRIIPAERLLAGVTYQGARLLEPGCVQHTGNGETALGALAAAGYPAAQRVAALLQQAGFAVHAEQDVSALRWLKLLVNAAINPLTALHRLPNGALTEDEHLLTQMRAVLEEGLAAAAAEGVALDFDTVWQQTLHTCRATAANHSSMLSDVEHGRRTEVDAINGSICSFAERHGIPTPVNRMLTEQVAALHPQE